MKSTRFLQYHPLMMKRIRNNASGWPRWILISSLLMLLAFPGRHAVRAADVPNPSVRTLRVVMDDDYPPYIFEDAEGHLKGILPDQWHLWEQKTGIHVLIAAMDWAEAQRRMQAGEFDVIDTIFRNETREKIYDFSNPYTRIEVPIVFRSDISGINGVDDLKGFAVAVKSGDNVIDVLRSHGITNLLEFNSYETIVAAARDRKINVFVIDKPPAYYYLYKFGINDQFRTTAPLYSGEFHRAVLKGNTALLRTIEDGFSKISKAEYEKIEKRWYGVPILSRESRHDLWTAIAVMAVVFAGLFLWVRILRRMVAQRTAALNSEMNERLRQEELLRKSEERLRLLVMNSSDTLIIFNADGGQRYISPAAERITGFSIAELKARTSGDLIHPEDMEAVKKAWATAIAHTEKTVTVQFRHIHKTQGWVFLEAIAQSFLNEPAISGLIASVRDISERKMTEESLRESEDKFRLMFNSSPDSISINRLGGSHPYVDINEGFTRTTGFSRDDVIGKTAFELNLWQDPEDLLQLVRTLQKKGFVENFEVQLKTKNGGIITGLMSSRVISLKGVLHFIALTRNITERKKYETEQLKIEKLESLGVLAGGIAHDFNNILTGILGNISFAKVFLDAAHKSYKPLSEAEKAAARAGELAYQLLTFARGGEPVKKVVSPQHLIHETLSFILHGSNVKGIIDIPDSIHAFEADEGQMSQVFQNIVINAIQAMPGGGMLNVSARNEVLDDRNTLSLPPGPYIRLVFADQGCGISEEHLKRIFDPYFTTKSAGIGLGLSSSPLHHQQAWRAY